MEMWSKSWCTQMMWTAKATESQRHWGKVNQRSPETNSNPSYPIKCAKAPCSRFPLQEICNNGWNLKFQPFTQQVAFFYVPSLTIMNNAFLKQSSKIIILFSLGWKRVIISSSSFNVISISVVGSEWTPDTNYTKSCLLQTNQGHEFSSCLFLFNFAKYFRCSLCVGLYIK